MKKHLATLVLLACTATAPAWALDAVALAPTFVQPVFLTAPTGDTRLFVVEKGGTIQVVNNGVKSKFQSLDATLSASYDVTDTFALGVSAIAQRTSAELTSAVNINAVGLQVQQGISQQVAAGVAQIQAAIAERFHGRGGQFVGDQDDRTAS